MINNFFRYSYILKIIYLIITTYIFFNLLNYYDGKKYIYIFFTVSISLLFLSSFNKKELKFFQFFFSIFLWLGFYYKLYICLIVIKVFPEGTGSFNFLGKSYDEVLIVSSLAFLGFYLGCYFSPKKIFNYINFQYLESTYYKFDKIILFLFILVIISIGVLNFNYSFFQKGFISNNLLDGHLRNIMGYLFMIGFGMIVSMIINFELNRGKFKIVYLALFETFFISLSMLSRVMIIELFVFIIGYISKLNQIKLNKISFANFFYFFIVSFILIIFSIVYVNETRNEKNIFLDKNENFTKELFINENTKLHNSANQNHEKQFTLNVPPKFPVKNENLNERHLHDYINGFTNILTSRFVGIEGVMAVQGHTNKNFELMHLSFKEKYKENKLSFYDEYFLKNTSLYSKSISNIVNQHAITLPGIIAFTYYSGSKFFVLLISFIIAFIFNSVSIAVKNIFNNPILTAFISNLLAYRLIHWGYAPLNSYKLFLSLFLSLIMIMIINYAIKKYYLK